MPARPAKPKDKAKVEVGVQVVERWILARLRHETFFTLAALNARIAELLEELNARPMKGYGGQSRRQLFDRFDRPVLQPLPLDRYVYGEWSKARVNIDYHVEVEEHLYSVPYPLIHSVVEICLTAATVEIVLRGQRVWLHLRSPHRGGFTTIPEHMPKAHRAHLEWTPSRLIRWAATIGPSTAALATTILAELPHMRIHDLRHSCASLLLAQGANIKVVQDLLGHSQVSLTLDTYSHLIPGVREDAADKMDALLVEEQAEDAVKQQDAGGCQVAVRTPA